MADGQEDLVETFLDFILERMVAEALMVRVGGGGDEERLRLNGEAALSLASMGLLRLLPVRDDFAPKDVLEEFLLDYYGTHDDAAMLWGRKILENLRDLGLLECVTAPSSDVHHADIVLGDALPSVCLPEGVWRRPAWWLQESGGDPTQSVHTSNVNLGCLHGDLLADNHRGSGRRRVRARVP